MDAWRSDLLRAELEVPVRRLVTLQDEMASTPRLPVETGLALFIEESRVYYVLQEVERLDRELRRVSRALREGRQLPLLDAITEAITEEPKPRGRTARRDPARPSAKRYGVDTPMQSSLRLADAGEGSTDLFLVPLGALVSVFASQPMTAIANAFAWSGAIGRVRAWTRRDVSVDPLEGVSARATFEILREANRDPSALIGPPAAEVLLPDGSSVRGSRVVVIRKYADGSSDYIEASG